MGTSTSKSGTFLESMHTENCHVVMLGLDSAGKTTALYRLKFDQYLNTVPTIGFNCEKVQGTYGRAKGVQFLIWDVGGQEKLRPLWRSYTRCTDGILFVVDSVDVERMEEAKMELMRTAKCPDNQGVPLLILANKQDLPGACSPKDLEKYLGLYELIQGGDFQIPTLDKLSSISSSSTANIVGCGTVVSSCSKIDFGEPQKIATKAQHKSLTSVNDNGGENTFSSFSSLEEKSSKDIHLRSCYTNKEISTAASPPCQSFIDKEKLSNSESSKKDMYYKGWYIQPACAITGEGLEEGICALYEMIIRRRKLNKGQRKKR